MVGAHIGPYEISGRLGAGGMGEVFLGHDPRLQRRVALKCLTKVDAHADELHARVLREARAAARLNHPNIAAVYDVLAHEGRTYIVMEYVEGISLAARIAKSPLPADQVRAIGQQLASALAAAHANGVIHRDLKPANIHIATDGSIKVLDFGVARLAPAMATSTGAPTSGDVDATLGGNPGTPIYMSPEQLLSKEIDARTDIYSAGAVLFEMATGRRPYVERGSIALALAMADAPAPSAASINPLVPPDLDAIIARALDRDPDRRFQSAREMERALSGMPASTTTAVAVRPSRIRRVALAALVIVAAATAVIVARRPTFLADFGPGSRSGRPTVLAILPIDNPAGDASAEYIGAGIASVVADNFGSIPGLTVLSGASTAAYQQQRGDLLPLRNELGADYVLDLSVVATAPAPRLAARLRVPGKPVAAWEREIAGDPLTVERSLLEDLAHALEDRRAVPRLAPPDWARVRRQPTTNGAALLAYSEARALLDRSDVKGNIERALGRLGEAVGADPAFALAYAAQSDAYSKQYARDQNRSLVNLATAAANKAISLDASSAAAHYSLGNMYYQTGDYQRAEQSLRHALDLQRANDAAHRLLGQVLAARGATFAAVAELEEAIRIRPFWNNYYALGFVLNAAGRFEDAIAPFRKTTELNPQFANGFQALGTVQHQLGDVQQAIGNYEHAVRLGPNAPAYANLALAYFEAGRYTEALATYERSLALNPKSVLNQGNIGDVYRALGRTADARAAWEKAVALGNDLLAVNPRDTRTIGLIAQREAKLGRSAEAQRHAAEALALAPRNREALQRSAEVHAIVGDYAQALKDLDGAIGGGYARRQARVSDELAPLRKLPEFQRLVADAPAQPGSRGGQR